MPTRGPALAPEELPRAFERFFLYSRYATNRAVGTGLGLAIVKELTEAMGGTVSVVSEPGRRRDLQRRPSERLIRRSGTTSVTVRQTDNVAAMDCANCGNPIRPEAVYCPRCGAKIDAPPPRGTPVADADLSPLERGLIEQLAKSRLEAQQADEGKLATGIEGLELERGAAEVLQLNEPGPNGAFEVTAEIIARLHHPEYGERPSPTR